MNYRRNLFTSKETALFPSSNFFIRITLCQMPFRMLVPACSHIISVLTRAKHGNKGQLVPQQLQKDINGAEQSPGHHIFLSVLSLFFLVFSNQFQDQFLRFFFFFNLFKMAVPVNVVWWCFGKRGPGSFFYLPHVIFFLSPSNLFIFTLKKTYIYIYIFACYPSLVFIVFFSIHVLKLSAATWLVWVNLFRP